MKGTRHAPALRLPRVSMWARLPLEPELSLLLTPDQT